MTSTTTAATPTTTTTITSAIERLKAQRGCKGVILASATDGTVLERHLTEELLMKTSTTPSSTSDEATISAAAAGGNGGGGGVEALTKKFVALGVSVLPMLRTALREVDADDDVYFVRVRSKKYELLVHSEEDYMIIAIQDPKPN
eukprot:PhM_4_TR7696/c0_g1_i1/m.93919/K10419/DYNLRB, DNCL2; dynein light chain roadblock-type